MLLVFVLTQIGSQRERGERTWRKKKINMSGRVSMPYTKGLSERIFREIMKHDISVVIHKLTATLKNILCSKAKDLLDPMDKPGALYHITDLPTMLIMWVKRENRQSRTCISIKSFHTKTSRNLIL